MSLVWIQTHTQTHTDTLRHTSTDTFTLRYTSTDTFTNIRRNNGIC